MLLKIPPKDKPSGKARASSIDPGTSASQSSSKRSTYNSQRAGLSEGLPPSTRARSQDPTVQRVQDRISASLQRASSRVPEPISSISSIPENPENLSNIFPSVSISSPIFSIQNFTMPETPAASSSARGHDRPSGLQASADNPGVVAYTSGTRKMPKPGEKNAPTFDTEKPEELGRFFERIEDWFAEEDIKDDADKKRRIVKYLDPEPEMQWKALPTFSSGTFEEFKAQVMASYPKAEEVMRGSVSALMRKISQMGPIAADERDELLALIRVMTAEILKLEKISPPIHTNRELVELFLKRLTPDFAARVANKLSVHRLVNPLTDTAGGRNSEDMYDVKEVMEIAKQASMEYANPFGKFLWTAQGASSDSTVKLEETMARLTDAVQLQSQYNKQVDQKLATLQNFMTQPRPQTQGGNYNPPSASQGFSRNLNPPTNNMMPGQQTLPQTCFYCAQAGHRITECEHALRHLDLGWIKKVDNFVRLPDGSKINRDGNKTMREMVEALNKPKPGLIQMARIPDKSSFYTAQSNVQGSSPEEEVSRTLRELMQKVGFDRVQQMIKAQAQEIEVDEEWMQNFD